MFRGQAGQRLTPRAVAAKMSRLCRRAKARPVSLYGYRHTFATVALTRGLPDAQVAALLGHSDTTMLHKHYSHLTSQSRALIDALGKVRP
ncbi:tyrosine-type recombinase/integrase [Gemmata sp.]|uniref:tyrosine-type recombinase/integrase n=1 Tax=Gemmata sp. TaxID=1914242 RepID=UPI003F717738